MRHLENAPIIEAIIDLKINPLSEDRLKDISLLADKFSNDFPHKEELIKGQMFFEISANSASKQVSNQKIGYRLLNHEKNKVLQITLEGFTFSLLPPYTYWKEFSQEAKIIWNAYVTALKIENLIRIAVRYINHLEIPLDGNDNLNEYLRILPTLQSFSNHKVSGMFMQIQMPQEDIDPTCMLIINEVLEPNMKPDHLAVKLDFDLFCYRPDNPWATDENEIWKLLEQLRQRKNEVFEASITDKTLEMLK